MSARQHLEWLTNWLPQDWLAAGQTGLRLFADFLGRHWVVGLANSAVTAVVGLALLWLASRLWPLRLFPAVYLQLRRLVYLVALFKGAFYLVVGDSMAVDKRLFVALGAQLPSPEGIDLSLWRISYSIWHPTSTTFTVSLVMGGIALGLFAVRVSRVVSSGRSLSALDQICGDVDPRVDAALKRAADAMKIGPKTVLPKILLVDVAYATPLLLGVRHPRLLISPRLTAMLSDAELEMALRHELAHFKRHDHWWRWIQLWVEDIGRPIFVTGRLGAWSVETEELLCDRLAVSSPRDASCLAQAITKAASLLDELRNKANSLGLAHSGDSGLEESVLPSLLGRDHVALSEAASLKRRIRELLALSHELSGPSLVKAASPLGVNPRILVRIAAELPLLLLLLVLLGGILYARFHLLLNF